MALDPNPSLHVKNISVRCQKIGDIGTQYLTTCPSLSMNRELEENETIKAQATKNDKKDVYEISAGAGWILIYAEGPMASQFRISIIRN